MQPLTWIAPYAGHVGMCDRDGIVYDFAGRRVGRDKMSFGWPARYLQLPPEAAHANGGSGCGRPYYVDEGSGGGGVGFCSKLMLNVVLALNGRKLDR